MAMTELPPVPEWFQESINQEAGMSGEHPNVRVVSGLDPNITEYYAGKWNRKYIRRETKYHEYTILHKPDGNKKILSPAEAKALSQRMNPKLGILLPVQEKEVKEFGIPRYFVELYKPPTAYGTPEAWESERFLSADEPTNMSGKQLDLLGEFPYNGGYDTWFCIEDAVLDSQGKAVATKFRELDEAVLEFIKYMIKTQTSKSAAEQHQETYEKAQKQLNKTIQETAENVRDAVKERINRLVGDTQVAVPSTYEKK